MRDLVEAALPFGGEKRRVWAEPPGPFRRLWVFLDAELYLDRLDARGALARVRARGAASDVRCVFVSHRDGAARHADYTCSDNYLRFLLDGVLPWGMGGAGGEGGGIVGVSLSGLAAAHAAVERPDVFRAAVCQSPSAWWNDEWLRNRVAGRAHGESRFWMSVGEKETETDVRHPPTGMHQKTSQRDSVGRLVEALRAAGADVETSTFPGEHDPAFWTAELPGALAWLGGSPGRRDTV